MMRLGGQGCKSHQVAAVAPRRERDLRAWVEAEDGLAAATASHSVPVIGRLLSCSRTVRPVDQKRESAKDKRWNDAREFGVDDMRAQRTDHKGAERQRSGSPPPGNQHTEASEN